MNSFDYTFYVLNTNSDIEKISKTQNVENTAYQSIIQEYFGGTCYMTMFPDIDDLYLIMSVENELLFNREKSVLPINGCMIKYYPNCDYKGIIIILKLDDSSDKLIPGKWDLEEIKFPSYSYQKDGFRIIRTEKNNNESI